MEVLGAFHGRITLHRPIYQRTTNMFVAAELCDKIRLVTMRTSLGTSRIVANESKLIAIVDPAVVEPVLERTLVDRQTCRHKATAGIDERHYTAV